MEKSIFCFLSTFLVILLVHRGHGYPTKANDHHAEDHLDNSTHYSLHRQPWVILIVADSSLNTSDITDSPSQSQDTEASLRRVRRQAPPNSPPNRLYAFGPSQGNHVANDFEPYVPRAPAQGPPPPPRPRPDPRPVGNPPPAAYVEHDLLGTMNVALGRLPEAVGVKLVDFLDSFTRWKLINLPNFG